MLVIILNTATFYMLYIFQVIFVSSDLERSFTRFNFRAARILCFLSNCSNNLRFASETFGEGFSSIDEALCVLRLGATLRVGAGNFGPTDCITVNLSFSDRFVVLFM